MGRRRRLLAGMPSVREWWREIARQERREVQARKDREEQKRDLARERSRRRPKCRCQAYPWPHRRGGGLCRAPDPPLNTWSGTFGKNKSRELRIRGLVKTLCREYGLHPIEDRERIKRLMPRLYPAWCKRNWPHRYWRLRLDGKIDKHHRLI